MARRRRRILYWHHSPKGFWWIGKKMVANEDPAGKGKNKASSRTFYTKSAAIRSLCRWGGLLAQALPVRGGWLTPKEWGSWEDDGSRAKEYARRRA
jgi:hypothetical protein